MATPTTPRRSGRERKANTRYEDQVAWNEDTLRLLRADSDTPDRSSPSLAPTPVQSVNDVDFTQVAEEEPQEEADDNLENVDDALDEEGSSQVAPEEAEPDGESVTTPSKPARKQQTRHKPRAKEWAKENGVRSRMFQDGPDKFRGAIKNTYAYNYGPELEDLFPILRSRDLWHLDPRDAILPSRASIKQATQLEAEGKYLHQMPIPEDVDVTHESLRHTITSPQHLNQISIKDASARRYFENDVSNQVVLGPLNQSTKYSLGLLRPIDVALAYQSSLKGAPDPRYQPAPLPELTENGVHAADGSTTSASVTMTATGPHRGWLINLGAPPQCLAWSPCNSATQYLAVTFKSTEAQRDSAPSGSTIHAPAFSPSPPYPSHIHILKLDGDSETSEEPAKLSHDQASSPHLHQQLCENWGNIFGLEWLPLNLRKHTTDLSRSLAVLSSDGNVRIVTTDLEFTGIQEVAHPHLVAQPPPHCVFTSFCLPSHEDLLVGDSSGALHCYNLNKYDTSGMLIPYTTIQIHNTYIMSITCATDCPHFLASTSAGGEMILTDLRSPSQDRVVVRKARLPTRNLAYFPFTRTFITTTDAAGNSEPTGTSLSTVVAHSLRHFYHTTTLLKLPECSGIATALAVSPFHPIILAANASGSVFASNVLKKMMPIPWKGAVEGSRSVGWWVKLYETDWREDEEKPMQEVEPDAMDLDVDMNDNQSSAEAAADPSTQPDPAVTANDRPNATAEPILQDKPQINLYHGRPTRHGVTRFYEGFRADRAELGNFYGPMSKRGRGGRASAANAAVSQIILPEEQAVTAMCWNPNPRFSSWCAIAWGSGLVCIRDLAHDAE